MMQAFTDGIEGTCCACGQAGSLRNIIMLNLRAPEPGSGWGCLICHQPMDGAIAIVCDTCLESERSITEVCTFKVSQPERTPIERCTVPFSHDMRHHVEEVAPEEDEPGWIH